jgi:hypothetical protein
MPRWRCWIAAMPSSTRERAGIEKVLGAFAVVSELRATGSPERVRAELAKREQELHRRSLLRASAALYAYLQTLGLTG